MEAIVENRRISLNGQRPEGRARKLKGCVAVLVWEEPDGSERTEVVGSGASSSLHLKGLLHDGIYLLAHKDDEGFAP